MNEKLFNKFIHYRNINCLVPLCEGKGKILCFNIWKDLWKKGGFTLINGCKWRGKAIKPENNNSCVYSHILGSLCRMHGAWTKYTIVTWFKTGNDITSRQFIYEEGGAVNGLNIYIYDDKVWIGAWIGIGSTSAVYNFLSYPVEQNKEYVVANVFDGNNKHKLIINGKKVAEKDINFSMVGHADICCLGNMWGTTVLENLGTGSSLIYQFKGLIYGLFIWKDVLTETEINALYKRCKHNLKASERTKKNYYRSVRNTGVEVDGKLINCCGI